MQYISVKSLPKLSIQSCTFFQIYCKVDRYCVCPLFEHVRALRKHEVNVYTLCSHSLPAKTSIRCMRHYMRRKNNILAIEDK